MKYLFLLFLLFNFLREGDANFDDSMIVPAIKEFDNTTIGDHGYKRRRNLLSMTCPKGSYRYTGKDFPGSYSGYCNYYSSIDADSIVDENNYVPGRIGSWEMWTYGTQAAVVNWYNRNKASCQDQDGCVICFSGINGHMWTGTGSNDNGETCSVSRLTGFGGEWSQKCPESGVFGRCLRCGQYGICLECPSGKYRSSSGATSINHCISWQTCGAGQYQSTAPNRYTNRVCSSCGSGRYQNNNRHAYTTCAACQKGQYQNSGGQAGCKACQKGQYSDQDAQSGCKVCPNGKYLTTEGNDALSDCDECDLGTGWDDVGSTDGRDASSDCIADSCSAGYYRSGSGTSRTCIACNDDNVLKYQDNNGYTGSSCNEDKGTCSPGERYNRNGDAAQNTCPNCGIGTYQNENGHRQSDCKDCGKGKYQNEEGKSSCKLCGTGKYLDSEGNDAESDCKGCAAGKFLDSTGNDAAGDCKTCEAGSITGRTGTGASTCTECTKGKFSPQSNILSCKLCSAGDYQSEDGGTSCTACGEGNNENKQAQQSTIVAFNNYHDGDAAYECINCPNGYDNQDGHKCEACQSGKFATSGNTCTDCGTEDSNKNHQAQISNSGNTFRTSTGAIYCVTCKAGRYNTNGGSCDQCSAGLYSFADAAGCRSCTKDHVQDIDSSYIHQWTSGVESDQTSDCYATSCKKGYKLAGSGSSTHCTRCVSSDYQGSDGGTVCTPCGYSSSNPNKQAQTSNSVGASFSQGETTSSLAIYCVNCPMGKDNNNNADDGDDEEGGACDDCREGWYNGVAGTGCDLCGQNKQAQISGDIGIDYYINNAATKCITCQNGYDNTNYGQCDICTGGMFSFEGTTCTHCPVGQQGQRSSTKGINEYTAEKAFQCVTCENGYDNTNNGQCDICPINYYSVNGETCAECPAGSTAEYGVDTGSVTEKATTCTECANGWYDDDSDSSTDCIQCPAGYNTDKIFGTGAVECVECPVGEWSPDSVTPCQAWSICPPGQYKHGHTKISNGECITCQDGTYCPGGTESIVIAESGSAATKWADLTVSSAECETFAGANWQGETSATDVPKGCYRQSGSSNIFYNTDTTSEITCVTNRCIQRKLSGTSSAVDVNHVGLRFFCSADYGGNGEGLTKHGDGGVDDGCTKCPDGFVGDSYYISETDVSRGDESMSLAECQAYGENLGSFSQISDTSFPWGCFMKDKDSAEYFYNVLQYNSNVLCNYDYGKSKCVKKIMEEGSTQCTECALGTWEIAGVCNPWIYADQTECPSGAAFVTGHSSLNSVCILDFVYENDEPSDMTLDLSIDSILCGEKYAQVDPQGNIVCTDCNRQEFLFVYRGPIVTTNPTYQRGSCCINSHHFVCEKMIDEYRKKCGSSHQKAVNVCV